MTQAIAEDDVEETVITTSTPEKRRAREPVRAKPQPPYAVVLWNDDDHTFDYVIEMLQKVCGHSIEQAFLLAKTVHEEGRASVWTGSKEVAELKCDQIKGFGPDVYASKSVTFPIGCTIEPMPG